MTQSGCQTLKELWSVALECNIQTPGITGEPTRILGFVQCSNVRNFMVMATLKCWEERGSSDPNSLPPIVIVDKTNSETIVPIFDKKPKNSSKKLVN